VIGLLALPERIASKIEPIPIAGCWLWTGGIKQSEGYGTTSAGSRSLMAHRYVYELLRGPIPTGLTLDHLCRVRSCVNPDHLRPCTLRENLFAPGSTGLAVRHSQKTHCVRGHDLATTAQPYRGRRNCVVCARERANAHYYNVRRPKRMGRK
jgi:hypothetical protein